MLSYRFNRWRSGWVFILRCSTHGALKPLPCPKDFKTSRGQVRSTGPRSSSGVSLEKTAVHSCQPGRRHHELEAKLFSAPLRWWLARGHCGRNEGGAANGRAIGWTILMLEYVGIGTKNYHELSTSSNININMSICISYVFASTWEVGLTQLPRAYTAAKGLRSLVMIYCTLVSKRSRRCKSNPWPWELP